MLGFLLIYIIGRAYYDLAAIYQKSKWTYAILGVLSYYVGTMGAGLFLALYSEMYSNQTINDFSDLSLSLMVIPFGILTCYIFYTVLKNLWTQELRSLNKNILDDNILDDLDGI